jgi:hypothetical protein
MSTVLLPVPELHPRSLGSRNTVPAGADPSTAPAGTSPFLHDTCPGCGWDGDAAIICDPDLGLLGWECPDCSTFIVTRDLEDA